MSDYPDNQLEFDYSDDLPEKPSVPDVVNALETYEGGIPGREIIYGLSELTDADLQQLLPTWETMDEANRLVILQNLVDASEVNIELIYDKFGFEMLNDPNENVRALAVELLWENESTTLLSRLIDLSTNDESMKVRAEAVKGVGRFILLGELGKLRDSYAVRAQDCVIQILNDVQESTEVRRRALEAIANSSLDMVPQAIHDAYEGADDAMQVSAIFAMGRSCDARWNDNILYELGSTDPERRFEAARAAGELQIEEAVPDLIRAWYNGDRETGEVVVWSLGEIGSNEAVRVLEKIQMELDEDDDDMQEAVEDALGNAQLMQGDHNFLFDMDD